MIEKVTPIGKELRSGVKTFVTHRVSPGDLGGDASRLGYPPQTGAISAE